LRFLRAEKMRDPFIAVNILANSLEELIGKAIEAAKLGFTHAWINPINKLRYASAEMEDIWCWKYGSQRRV